LLGYSLLSHQSKRQPQLDCNQRCLKFDHEPVPEFPGWFGHVSELMMGYPIASRQHLGPTGPQGEVAMSQHDREKLPFTKA
jgi:hypothetical protein